jgi:hypothetical protein
LIGQDDEGVGLHQISDQSTQGVVVTKLDFVIDHRVVFIDDRQHPVREQGQQSGTRIEVALTVGQVGMRE